VTRTRVEASPAGRVLISLGVGFTVLAMVVLNMPDSQLRSSLMTPVAPYVRAVGLDQDWAVFAPPRSFSLQVEGHLEYADGTTSVERFPRASGIAAYADYRWRKYEERLRLDVNERLWARYALFLADRARAEGRSPVRVSLVRRWADTRPPGPGPERDPWREFTFYTVRVG
jgi:hypothetical protein